MSPRLRGRAGVARLPGCAAWILLATVCGGGRATAQAPEVSRLLGRPVAAVHVDVEGRAIEDEALLSLVETHVDAPLTVAAVRESILHLFSLGRYEDVRVDALATAAGVDLRFQLVPIHPVGDLEFRGDLGLSAGALRSAVSEQYGRTPPAARLADMVGTVDGLLRARGFMNPSVTARAEIDHSKEETILIFDVAAGARARVGTVTIEASAGESADRLTERFGIQRGQPYDSLRLERRLEEYVATLRDRGFYLATVDYSARVDPRGETIDLTLTVDRGPRVVVTFEGDELPSDRRAELVEIRREGSIDLDLLEDSGRRIDAFLRNQGYWRASTQFRRRERDELLEVIFDVSRGDLYRIARVEVLGADAVSTTDLLTRAGLRAGTPFVQTQLDAAVQILSREYRQRGFVDASVDGVVEEVERESSTGVPEPRVVVRIVVEEGVRTIVSSVTFEGNTSASAEQLAARIDLRDGMPFYEPDVVVARDLVLLDYLNRGYQNATVDARAEFRADRSLCDVVFSVDEGDQIVIDHVLIVGNDRIGRDTIQRELLLQSGDPLALDDLIESQRRLRALGVFRSVQITELTGTQSNARDLLVTVDESPATSIGYGGGLEAGRRLRRRADGSANEELEFAPRGFFEIGRRNLWGKNRSIDLFTRVSVRRGEDLQQPDQSAGFGFNEYRVIGTYREPRPFGWNAEFLASAFLEQAIRSSFNFNRRGVNAEVVRRVTPQVNVSARYSFDRTKLFNERFNPADELLIDRLFPQVRLSTVSQALVRDTRGDPLDPRGGDLFSIDTKLAGRGIGSQVGFAKALVQGFMYRQLPAGGRTVLAVGARLGLAVGFRRNVARETAAGDPVLDASGQAVVDEVDDLPASERFFAGGDSTVRGFALDRLGTTETIDSDGFPKGGNALVIVNAELRVPVWRDVGAVVFLDGGNVFARVSRIDFGEMRGSVGFGLRYRSPVGPIRVDLGFKLDRRTFDNGVQEPRTALHVSIGQAF